MTRTYSRFLSDLMHRKNRTNKSDLLYDFRQEEGVQMSAGTYVYLQNRSKYRRENHGGSNRLMIAAAILCFLLQSGGCLAAEYYLSASGGKDTNRGTSPAQPWKSFERLKLIRLQPGDTVYLKRGDIWREKLVLNGSGTKEKWITITSFGAGDKPMINGSDIMSGWSGGNGRIYTANARGGEWFACLEDGKPLRKAATSSLEDGNWFSDKSLLYYRPTTGTPREHRVEVSRRWLLFTLESAHHIIIDGVAFYSGSNGINIIDSQNILIRNCDVLASAEFGISLRRNVAGTESANITISNNTISYCGNGIYIMAKQDRLMSSGYKMVSVLNNKISYSNYQGVWGHMTKDGHAIGVQNTSSSHFEGNMLWKNYSGICLWTGPAGTDHRSDNNVFAGNFIDSSQQYGISFGGENNNNAANNIFAYNIISNNGTLSEKRWWGGIRINKTQVTPNYFVNNTLYNNDTNFFLNDRPDYFIFKNNISLDPARYHVVVNRPAGVHNIWDNNGYYSQVPSRFLYEASGPLTFSQWKERTKQDGRSLDSDPRLSSSKPVKAEDFVLKPGSPYLKKGAPLALDLRNDFFGKTISVPPDIGASGSLSSEDGGRGLKTGRTPGAD